MESNNNKRNFVDIPKLNLIIEKMGYKGTYINSATIHPVHEYNVKTAEFEIESYTYDVDIITDEPSKMSKMFKDLNKFTNLEFIISSVNNNGYVVQYPS